MTNKNATAKEKDAGSLHFAGVHAASGRDEPGDPLFEDGEGRGGGLRFAFEVLADFGGDSGVDDGG